MKMNHVRRNKVIENVKKRMAVKFSVEKIKNNDFSNDENEEIG